MSKRSDKPHILIVDDEQDIQDMLSRHYRFSGYEVLTASNGAEALEVMAIQRVEVVISDILMPEMDGIELLYRLRQDYPTTHVIIMTGYVTMENLLSAMRYGADTCVFKPLTDFTEMDECVEHAIKHLKIWQKKLRELQSLKGSNQ